MAEDDDKKIIDMSTPMSVLADWVRAGHQRAGEGSQEWVEGVLEMASAMHEAREPLPERRSTLGHLDHRKRNRLLQSRRSQCARSIWAPISNSPGSYWKKHSVGPCNSFSARK